MGKIDSFYRDMTGGQDSWVGQMFHVSFVWPVKLAYRGFKKMADTRAMNKAQASGGGSHPGGPR